MHKGNTGQLTSKEYRNYPSFKQSPIISLFDRMNLLHYTSGLHPKSKTGAKKPGSDDDPISSESKFKAR